MKTTTIQHMSAGWYSVSALVLLSITGVPEVSAHEKESDALLDASTNIDHVCLTPTPTPVDTTAALAAKFTALAGSEANATALVNGLLTGSSVALTSTVDGMDTTTTFTPVATTNPNYGSVFISLKLAQEELHQIGIANPTPAQLEAVLNGGTITATSGTVTESGILTLRASGQTWNQIATALDVKTGHACPTPTPVNPTAKLAEKFTALAGSEANATALVNGLRTGSSITLTSTVDGVETMTTFTPATTKTTGYGNVYIELSLAQKELAKLGITNPTPVELEAALNGGSVTTATGTVSVSGILALRASGQGWGQIAKTLDVKLGHVLRDAHDVSEHLEKHLANDTVKGDHTGKTERVAEKVERAPSKVEHMERAERVQRAERVERVERVAAVDRPVRIERLQRPERPKH